MQTGARPAASSRAPASGAPPRPAFEPGESVGRWRVERMLKAGPVFEVWAASDAAGVPVAVKTPRPFEHDNGSARTLVRHEHACLGTLEHAHIVAARDLVETRARTALVTEWLGGGDLVSLAGSAFRHWLAPLGDLVAAVTYLHTHRFVHRDIKARNVMLDVRGRARLIDFASAARVDAAVAHGGTTDAHRRLGDPGERAVCDDDAYALAVLIYELCTGGLPRGVSGRERAPQRPPRSGETGLEGVLDWAMAWLDPGRGACPGITALAAVLNLADSS